jgi:hypothetical protein
VLLDHYTVIDYGGLGKAVQAMSRRAKARKAPDADQQALERYREQLQTNREAAEELQLATKRVGETTIKRMQWALNKFAQQDLDLLRPEERVALGYDLRGLVAVLLPRSAGYRFYKWPMPDDELRGYQRAFVEGLEGLLSDPPRPWIFPAGEARVIAETLRPNRRRFAIQLGGDESAAVLGGLAMLVTEAGERLRRCQDCGIPFVAIRKEEYCGPSHAQRARNKRRPIVKRKAKKGR